MILTDVNVLLYGFRTDAVDHPRYREWIERTAIGPEPFGISTLVLSGFIRIATNPRIHIEPAPLATAIAFANTLLEAPASVLVAPGPQHWPIFTELCEQTQSTGNLVPDAYFAALAIESGSEWITTDRDYSRFPRLRWRHPFEKNSRLNPA